MDGDSKEIRSMQAGIRAWVLRVAHESGHRLREDPAPVLLSALCAAAFAPVALAAVGTTGGVIVPAIGVLSSVGTGFLNNIVAEAVNRLRRKGQGKVRKGELEEEIDRQIRDLLGAGGEQAHSLRAEIATVLNKIDAGGTAWRAAVRSGNAEVRRDIVALMGEISACFTEMQTLLAGVTAAAAAIQTDLGMKSAQLQVLLDQSDRQLTEARLTREMVRIIEQRTPAGTARDAVAGIREPRWVHDCPYRGLLPFGEADAEVFYGRERLTAELVSRLAGQLTRPGIIIVTGASGAGKSSLLRAGLLPALARGLQLPGSADWPRMVLTPTMHPLAELATRLAVLGGGDSAATLRELTNDPGQTHLAVRQAVLADATRRTGGRRPVGADSER